MRPRLCAALLALLPGLNWGAELCDTDRNTLNQDTDEDLVLCGEGLPAQVRLVAADSQPVELRYQQVLKRCGVNDDRPGLHLVLNSSTRRDRLVVAVQDANTDATACELRLKLGAANDRPLALERMPVTDARFVDVQGIRTRYFEAGEGPPLVLVHGGQAGGSNNNAQKWEDIFPLLAEYYRVIALDRLAQAGTDNLPAAGDYADYFARDAAHLENFLDALELEQVILAGHSQGGWPVTRVALNRPELVRCLVNIDTVMVPDDPQLMSDALGFLLYTSRFLHPAEGPTFYSARRGMRLRYPSGNNPFGELKARRIVAQHQTEKTRAAREAMAAEKITPLHPSFAALKKQAYGDIADGKLQARSLLIWGAQDPQVPVGLGRALQQQLKADGVDSKLVIIGGAGHAPFVEFPASFVRLLRAGCETPPSEE